MPHFNVIADLGTIEVEVVAASADDAIKVADEELVRLLYDALNKATYVVREVDAG
jgi:hypothetical protein